MATRKWDSERDHILTIPTGATESDILDMRNGKGAAFDVLLVAPAALTGTVNVHVAVTPTRTFRALQSGNIDVTLTANKATQLDPLSAGALKLVSSSAEGADRVFEIKGETRQ